eukprot:869341-Rhodomonas_salina.1
MNSKDTRLDRSTWIYNTRYWYSGTPSRAVPGLVPGHVYPGPVQDIVQLLLLYYHGSSGARQRPNHNINSGSGSRQGPNHECWKLLVEECGPYCIASSALMHALGKCVSILIPGTLEQDMASIQTRYLQCIERIGACIGKECINTLHCTPPVSYTHLRAHETEADL